MVKHITQLGLFFLATGLLPVAIFNCASAASQETSVPATVNIPAACSMTATRNKEHSVTLLNGQESTDGDFGLTTIKVSCNDKNGFSLYAAGYTGGVVGATNSTKLVGANSGETISTGLGNADSNWGMKVSAATGTANSIIATIDNGYNEYSIVPSGYTKVAHITTATYQGAPTEITTTYRAYVSPTQASDSYSGRVRYVLVHPSSAVAQTTFESAFAAAGKNPVQVNGNYYYAMQDMTTDICNGVVDYGTERQLVDIRDQKLYWILKAADGKCWMTQNLDLDLEKTATNVAVLTSLNTDLNEYDDDIYNSALGYTHNESTGLITWTPASSTYHNKAIHENGTKTGDAITNSNTTTAPRSWDLTVNNSEIYQKDGSTFASATCNYYANPSCLGSDKNFNTAAFAANGEHGKLGNYYNWSAAVASNNTSSRTASTYNTIAENPKNSICPKGWRLTRSSSTAAYNDFQSLFSTYGSAIGKANGSPLWLVRAGNVNSGSLSNSGNYGLYWSSTVYSSSSAYYLDMNSSGFSPSYGNNRLNGYSVRCVAR